MGQQFTFEGVNSSLIDQVMKKSSRLKSPLERSDIIIRELMATDLFQSTNFLYNKDANTIKVTAIPRVSIQSFKVTGADSIDLSGLSRPDSLRPGSIFNQEDVIAYASKVKDFLFEDGYLKSHVEAEISTKKNKVNVNIQVKLGEQTQIKEVQILTKNIDLQQILLREAKKFYNKPLTQKYISQIKERLKERLLELGYFRTQIGKISPVLNREKSLSRIDIEVSNPFQYAFFTKGNTKYGATETTIIRQLRNSELLTAPTPPRDFARDFVTRLYHEKGFADVVVKTTEQELPDAFRKEILVEINEGVRVKIKKISFTGKFSKPEKFYTDFLKEHSSQVIEKGFLHIEGLKTGLANLNTELKNRGFLKAQIKSHKVEKVKKGIVNIAINLDEGPLTQIRSIQFKGNKSYSNLELSQQLIISHLQPLKLKELEGSIQKLQAFYQRNGFLEMKVINKKDKVAKYSEDNTEVDILFSIHEGPQVKASSILIKGLSKTKPHIVSRELTFKSGDILNPTLIKTSKAQLEGLGLFSTVRIYTAEENTSVGERTVIVQLREKNPGIIRFGAGITNERDFTVRGYIAGSYSNLGGTGRAISARAELNLNVADINFPEHRVTLGYLEPHLWDSQWDGRVNLRRSQNIFEVNGDAFKVLERNEGSILIDRKFTPHFRFSYNILNLSFLREFEENGDSEEVERVIGSTGPSFEFDFRDDIFNPTSGSFSRLSFEYADPNLFSSETIQFIKTTARFSYYIPITSKVTFANSLRGGYLKNISNRSDSGIPFTEAFFLGGQSTVRGFDALDERFPTDSELGFENDIENFLVTGESHFGLFKSEIRFPLPFIDTLRGSIFYDGGIVAVSGFDFEDAYRDSVGFGFHIITPVGPVNFDFGFKLDRKKELGESPFEFHFSIGSF